MYRYILFDLDGTLTDPREGITKCVQYALRHMGIEEPNLSSLEHFIGPPLYDEFICCYGFSEQQAKESVSVYRERFGRIGWRENLLFDGVPDLLQALRKSGCTLAIASSKPVVFVEKILDLFAIAQFFDVVSGASLDGSVSTKAQVVERALSRLGVVDKSHAVLVGDRMHDVEGAHQNGIACVGLTMGFGGRSELAEAGAEHIVNTMDELQRLLLHDGAMPV